MNQYSTAFFPKRAKRQGGAVYVEASLSFIAFFMVIAFALELGWLITQRTLVNTALQQAGEAAATSLSADGNCDALTAEEQYRVRLKQYQVNERVPESALIIDTVKPDSFGALSNEEREDFGSDGATLLTDHHISFLRVQANAEFFCQFCNLAGSAFDFLRVMDATYYFPIESVQCST